MGRADGKWLASEALPQSCSCCPPPHCLCHCLSPLQPLPHPLPPQFWAPAPQMPLSPISLHTAVPALPTPLPLTLALTLLQLGAQSKHDPDLAQPGSNWQRGHGNSCPGSGAQPELLPQLLDQTGTRANTCSMSQPEAEPEPAGVEQG